jgi:prevent-host-death family protein
MAKEINALELRKHFGEIMEAVRYRKEPYVVTRNGRPMIVLIDIEAYDAAEAQRREDAFIETYSDERIEEFLKEDTVSPQVRKQVKRALK